MLCLSRCLLLAAALPFLASARPAAQSPTASPAPSPTPGTCNSGVYLIVARGSEEAAGEGKSGQVANMVAAQLPGSHSVAVNYPASIVDPVYPDSVTDGINDTINKIQSYVKTCGAKAKIALVGYSQGGNVMTDVLAGGVDKPTPLAPSYAQYIKAVSVFGDPSYTTGQSFDVGNSTSSGTFARGGSSLAMLNTYASVLQSYCMADDVFCASGDSLAVHSAEVATFASAATTFIVSKVS